MRRDLAACTRFVHGIAAFLLTCVAAADGPGTRQVDGLRENRPGVWVLTNARVVVSPGRVIPSGTVVIRRQKIVAVGSEIPVPEGARVLDLSGKTIYPGLIDGYGEEAIKAPARDPGGYWNANVLPELSVSASFRATSQESAARRRQGVVARLVAPQAGVIKGVSALLQTATLDGVSNILQPDVALQLELTNRQTRRKVARYPTSPMGAVALARQAFHDAAWYAKAWRAVEADPSLPLPEQNPALDVLHRYLDPSRLVIVAASDELQCLRADRFAREFGLRLAVRGSGHEYRRLEAIRETHRTVIVPVNFPKPPDVSTPEAAMDARLESLMHWDLAPENPARLVAAGVAIVLSSHGLSDPACFLAAVRRAVARGLSGDEALRALTTRPAELFGVDHQLGSVEPGKLASLIVTDGDLFDRETKVLETWVGGRRFRTAVLPAREVDGLWELSLDDVDGEPTTLWLEVRVKGRGLRASLRRSRDPGDAGDPGEARDSVKLLRVRLEDTRLSGTFEAKSFGTKGVAQLSLVVESDTEGSGQVVWPAGDSVAVTGRRQAAPPPDAAGDAAGAPSDSTSEEPSEEPRDDPHGKVENPCGGTSKDGDVTASFEVNYPLGAFGRAGVPEQPESVLFRGATVWTCGPRGVLHGASVLIGGGKVLAVGRNIAAPAGAVIVPARGKHLTPGLIDCHSHMASDGGINESGQAITAEVRIGDFIDSDDITIYRQLAGGLTCANILHGSANPIGGQNQVIKLRWGALDEELKFSGAPAGIKFALGENVKQSNWGDKFTTRYPQTRMGVEQLFRDAFRAAKAYGARREAWRANQRGLPLRKDLELDALYEVLEGTRWIHCHSYRQDEILALLRVLDEFGVTIGTLQHILEGYKVAEAMQAHGAMASTFSDWWAYKFEVYDAIPYAGALMHDVGVVVSFNSDDPELGRHMNQEAAKAIKYGGVTPEEALKFVTLNPAKQLRIDNRVGSIEVGKDADLVLWSAWPLSNFARCEQTWIDGRRYFDDKDDLEARQDVSHRRAVLIQKILASGEAMHGAEPSPPGSPHCAPFSCRDFGGQRTAEEHR